jgi:hypothetical protein
MTIRKLLFNLLFRGRPFKAEELKFDIEWTGNPIRETVKDIAAHKQPDIKKNDAVFRQRTKKKEDFTPIRVKIEGVDKDGNPIFKPHSAEALGVVIKKS